jgi:segregation and condensation protein B
MNESHIRNVIEAALLAAGKPLQPAELIELFDEGARPEAQDIQAALATLAAEYSGRGIEIKETAAGFRIQVRRELANEISRLWPERPARYSRALLETLALIAYRQPITRAEIEAVRGVAVNPNILKTVIERNWVRVVGHRDVPGRPELLGTTREFLDYFGLKSLDELPPLAELKSLGDIKVQFELPDAGPVAVPGIEGEVAAVGVEGVVGGGDAAVAGADVANAVDDGADGTAAGEDVAVPGADTGNGAANEEAGIAGHVNNAAAGDDGVVLGEAYSTDEADRLGQAGSHAATSAHDHMGTDARGLDGSSDAGSAHDDGGAHDDLGTQHRGHDGSRAAAGAHDDVGAHDGDQAGSRHDAVAHDDATGNAANDGSGARRDAGAPLNSAQHGAEEFVASIDAELAAGDDDSADDDELSASGPDSSELVAGPRDLDD